MMTCMHLRRTGWTWPTARRPIARPVSNILTSLSPFSNASSPSGMSVSSIDRAPNDTIFWKTKDILQTTNKMWWLSVLGLFYWIFEWTIFSRLILEQFSNSVNEGSSVILCRRTIPIAFEAGMRTKTPPCFTSRKTLSGVGRCSLLVTRVEC